MNQLTKELLVLQNKVRYIREILNDTIDLRKKKKEEVITMLTDKKYSIINDDIEFKYLVKMSMDSVTEENINKLSTEHDKKAEELDLIQSKTIQNMWLEELTEVLKQFNIYQEDRQRASEDISIKKTKIIKKKLKIAE